MIKIQQQQQQKIHCKKLFPDDVKKLDDKLKIKLRLGNES
jgi:hypothetical protein